MLSSFLQIEFNMNIKLYLLNSPLDNFGAVSDKDLMTMEHRYQRNWDTKHVCILLVEHCAILSQESLKGQELKSQNNCLNRA